MPPKSCPSAHPPQRAQTTDKMCEFCLLLKSKNLNLVPLYCCSITQN